MCDLNFKTTLTVNQNAKYTNNDRKNSLQKFLGQKPIYYKELINNSKAGDEIVKT